MSGGIYLVHGDGKLVEMTEQDYASEDLLQELLAKYPNPAEEVLRSLLALNIEHAEGLSV